MPPTSTPPPVRSGDFATTRWSLVLRAGDRADAASAAALAVLCERYWYPLYGYVRRRTSDVSAAQDLTQEFFSRLLEKNALAHAAPERGRFRGFLLASVKNFLANEWDRGRAEKRGGGARILSLDFDSGESRLGLEPAHDETPERAFDRQWAVTLLAAVLERLAAEYAAAGKGPQFERLRPALTGDREGLPYAELAADLELTEAAARQTVSRLRKRYRELLREEVGQTVGEPEDVEDEIRRLFAVLAD